MRQAVKETWSTSIMGAAGLSGCSESLIRALVAQGILEGVETEEGPAVTISSLVRWLNQRPDALRLPPRLRPHEKRYSDTERSKEHG